MAGSSDTETPVRAKALLVDPETMAVRWTNEPVGSSLSWRRRGAPQPLELTQAVPMSDALGLPDVVREVWQSGIARHLGANLVTTGKGAVAYVVSVYRLPDGAVLVLTEHAWHVKEGAESPSGTRRSQRRR